MTGCSSLVLPFQNENSCRSWFPFRYSRCWDFVALILSSAVITTPRRPKTCQPWEPCGQVLSPRFYRYWLQCQHTWSPWVSSSRVAATLWNKLGWGRLLSKSLTKSKRGIDVDLLQRILTRLQFKNVSECSKTNKFLPSGMVLCRMQLTCFRNHNRRSGLNARWAGCFSYKVTIRATRLLAYW